MKKLFLFIYLLSLGLLVNAQQFFSSEKLKEDFKIIRAALEEAHPGLYRYNSKSVINAGFENIEKQLNQEMTEQQFFKLVYPFLVNIGDGHLKFHRDGKPDDFYSFAETGYFPLRLYFKDNKAFVRSSFAGKDLLPKGVEIYAINGEKISSIISTLFKNIMVDGKITSTKYEELNQFFPGYYATFIGAKTEFLVSYKSIKGEKSIIRLKAIKNTEVKYNKVEKSLYSLSYPKQNTALITISLFQENNKASQYEDFLANSFKEIKNKKIINLIIDLRDNEGGTDAFGIKLYSYIANRPFRYYEKFTVAGIGPYSFASYATFPPQFEYLKQFVKKVGNEYYFMQKEGLDIQQPANEAFRGKVYVLQNGKSFSVSSEFAAITKDNNRAVFVGDESGGAFDGNSSGAFVMVKLPNTKLGLDIPLLGYYMYLKKPFKNGRGVEVNYNIIPDITDVIEKKDVVLQKALQLIN